MAQSSDVALLPDLTSKSSFQFSTEAKSKVENRHSLNNPRENEAEMDIEEVSDEES